MGGRKRIGMIPKNFERTHQALKKGSKIGPYEVCTFYIIVVIKELCYRNPLKSQWKMKSHAHLLKILSRVLHSFVR